MTIRNVNPMNFYDFVRSNNPSTNENVQLYSRWLNASTGETFTCIDNTPAANRWASNLGYVIEEWGEDVTLTIINWDGNSVPSIGWTNESGTLLRRGPSGAPSGGNYFYSQDATTIVRQTIDISAYRYAVDNLGLKFTTDYWYGGYSGDNDSSSTGARFRDGSLNVISGDTYNSQIESDNPWFHRAAFSVNIPVGARYIDLLVKMIRTGGADNNGYWDDINSILELQ